MARPLKRNADYFSHDKDMRNNLKIKALRRKYGHTGYAVWNMLLEVLTDADDFKIQFNQEDKFHLEIIAADFDIEPGLLIEIVEYMELLGLIKNVDNFLFSVNMIERFNPLMEKRTKQRIAKTLIEEALNKES
jgi:hypothetical protein